MNLDVLDSKEYQETSPLTSLNFNRTFHAEKDERQNTPPAESLLVASCAAWPSEKIDSASPGRLGRKMRREALVCVLLWFLDLFRCFFKCF